MSAFKPFAKDPKEREALVKERQQRVQAEAIAKWQYVNVVFANANTDQDIAHALAPTNPETVRYEVIRQSANAVIFQDLSVTRKPWSNGVIRLRASVPTAARILLFLEQDSSTPGPAATTADGYVPPGTGSITTVGLVMPPEFSVSGSPLTGSGGTITVGLTSQTANYLFAGPASGVAAAPTFRAMVNADLYPTPQFTSVAVGAPLATNASSSVSGQFVTPMYNAGNSGTALTINWENGNDQELTLTGNVTLTFSNPTNGGRTSLIIHTGSGGFTVTWPSSVSWSGGTAPVITSTASKMDLIAFHYVGSVSEYIGAFIQNFS